MSVILQAYNSSRLNYLAEKVFSVNEFHPNNLFEKKIAPQFEILRALIYIIKLLVKIEMARGLQNVVRNNFSSLQTLLSRLITNKGNTEEPD